MIRVILATLVISTVAFAQASHANIGAKRFTAELTVPAKPDAVCAVLTDCEKQCKILGNTKDKCTATLNKIGAYAAMEVLGDKGTMHVVYYKPNKELRLYFEPDNGSYLCESKWTLTPTASGTKINYEERYTESGPMSQQAIDQCQSDINKGLALLKEYCGGK